VFTHVIEEIAKDFTATTGHTDITDYYTVAQVKDRIEKGEVTGVVILTRAPMDGILAQGRIAVGNILDIVRSGVGMAVRRGAAKPDISTVDAFKRTLLAARTIGYPDPARGGASGLAMTQPMEF
jgi:molybdate transport system substrate-binding protein